MTLEREDAWPSFRAQARSILSDAWLAAGSPTAMPEFEDDANLFESGAVDSFLIIELVYGLGKAYGLAIELSDLDPEQLSSIRGLYTALGGVTA